MKIVTSVPAQLANQVDIVDRNIIGNLDLSQETIYPIETVPDQIKFDSPSNDFMRNSFSLFSSASVANAVSLNTILGIMGRGLWRLRWTIQYVANYAQLTASGFNLSLNPVDGSQGAVFVTLAPVVGTNLIVSGNVKFLLGLDSTLAFFLLTNAVGQAHSANVSVTGEKYL